MPDETTTNPEPTNTAVPQPPETLNSRPSEVVVAPASAESLTEPILVAQTAQLGGNEPFAPMPIVETPASETPEVAPTESTQPTPAEPAIETASTTPTPAQVVTTVVTPVVATAITQSFTKSIRELFTKAQLVIQNKKRKKLNNILTLFAKQTNITNDEVEKFLHVSDATATRYLSILENENKIKQVGKTGKEVSYSKI